MGSTVRVLSDNDSDILYMEYVTTQRYKTTINSSAISPHSTHSKNPKNDLDIKHTRFRHLSHFVPH